MVSIFHLNRAKNPKIIHLKTDILLEQSVANRRHNKTDPCNMPNRNLAFHSQHSPLITLRIHSYKPNNINIVKLNGIHPNIQTMVRYPIHLSIENVNIKAICCTDYFYIFVSVCQLGNIFFLLWEIENTLDYC